MLQWIVGRELGGRNANRQTVLAGHLSVSEEVLLRLSRHENPFGQVGSNGLYER